MPKQPVLKTTPSLTDEQLAALQGLIPQAFTEGKIDPEKLRVTLGSLAPPATSRGSNREASPWDKLPSTGSAS